MVNNIANKLMVGNKKRLRLLSEKADAERAHKTRNKTVQRMHDFKDVPMTERWKQQSYQHFKLPLGEFIERERIKKEVKNFNMPFEVTNYIQDCLKDKLNQSGLGESPKPVKFYPEVARERFEKLIKGGIVSTKP